jgi:hypothetical protein
MRVVICISRFFQERAKLAAMSRKQSTASPDKIQKQRVIVHAARKELLLDQHIAALVAGVHELTEKQHTQIRQVLWELRSGTIRRT